MIFNNKKSISALIATILLIVVAVALIVILLTWSKSFTTRSISQVDDFKDAGGVYFFQSVRLVNGTLIFKNISTVDSDVNIIGYKIIAKDPDTNAQIQYLRTSLIVPKGSQNKIRIRPPTDVIFSIQLFTNDGKYITIKDIVNPGTGDGMLGTVVVPVADVEEGEYNNLQTITLSTTTEDANIYYTTNGEYPTEDSTLYENPIELNETTTLNAVAFKPNWNESEDLQATYTFIVADPTSDISEGEYNGTQTISLSTITDGADIYYTLDGSTPTQDDSLYSGPFDITESTTLKFRAYKSGYTASSIITFNYTIIPYAATPTADPVGGTYTSAQSVTLSTETEGADIYYTLDGEDPTLGSTLYTTPIDLNEETTFTLKAITANEGYYNSSVMSETYILNLTPVAKPVASPVAGTFDSSQSVTLSSATSGASIYYTINGDEPTTSSTLYSTAITISTTTTLKAIAAKPNYIDSNTLTAEYVINLFAAGSGTSGDPYQVGTANELNNVRYYLDKYFIQVADINMYVSPYKDGNGFVPIGDLTNYFSGNYNGDNHKITNLYIDRTGTDYVGLFGDANHSTLSNIIIEDGNIRGNVMVGTLAGTVRNSNVTNTYATGDVNAYYLWTSVGGLIGYFWDSNISNSHFSGNVKYGQHSKGGLIGGSGNSIISHCYSTGTVTGYGYSVGGLVGYINNSLVTNSWSTSTVSAGAGYYVGGIVGRYYDSNSIVSNCYSTGAVTAGMYYGGLAGYGAGTITGSYYDSTTSGRSDNTGKGVPKTTAQMKQQATFVGWDFNVIWNITEGVTYPFFR